MSYVDDVCISSLDRGGGTGAGKIGSFSSHVNCFILFYFLQSLHEINIPPNISPEHPNHAPNFVKKKKKKKMGRNASGMDRKK